MRKLFLFFIDGIGLGIDDPEVNPIRGLFSPLMGGAPFVEYPEPLRFPGGVLIPADAVLGVEGIPQSATGQTSIFTGINAQALIGSHLSAYPNDVLKAVIMERSLMKVLEARGVRVTAANLYSDEFFEKRRGGDRNLFPVSTLTIMASHAGFRLPEDYRAGMAVFADITNRLIKSRGYDIELIEPELAAEHALSIIAEFDFVFFEYFMTDFHGHKRRREELTECVDVLNRFLSEVWAGVDRSETSILVVSDHGNAEDFTTGDHTTNPVPVLLLSEDPAAVDLFASTVKDLTHVHGAVLRYFGLRE